MFAPPPLLVIDAPMVLFQGFFGVPDEFHDPAGRPVNAVLGFARRLATLLRQTAGMRVFACWDESLGTGFRHRLLPAYKANRPPADAPFLFQMQACKELLHALGIPQTGSDDYEADDLMASAVAHQRRAGGRSVVVSHDKDLAQIIAGEDLLWRHPAADPVGEDALTAEWGFPVARIADYLALAGDAADNIPGLPRIGARTAAILMAAVDSLEALYEAPTRVHALPVRGAKGIVETLLAHREEAFLYRDLTRLRDDALDADAWSGIVERRAEAEAVEACLGSLGLWKPLAGPMASLIRLRQEVPDGLPH